MNKWIDFWGENPPIFGNTHQKLNRTRIPTDPFQKKLLKLLDNSWFFAGSVDRSVGPTVGDFLRLLQEQTEAIEKAQGHHGPWGGKVLLDDVVSFGFMAYLSFFQKITWSKTKTYDIIYANVCNCKKYIFTMKFCHPGARNGVFSKITRPKIPNIDKLFLCT